MATRASMMARSASVSGRSSRAWKRLSVLLLLLLLLRFFFGYVRRDVESFKCELQRKNVEIRRFRKQRALSFTRF
jgi:hypothetical protein